MLNELREPTIEERLKAVEIIAEISLGMALQASPHGKENAVNMTKDFEAMNSTELTPPLQLMKRTLERIAPKTFPDWQQPP